MFEQQLFSRTPGGHGASDAKGSDRLEGFGSARVGAILWANYARCMGESLMALLRKKAGCGRRAGRWMSIGEGKRTLERLGALWGTGQDLSGAASVRSSFRSRMGVAAGEGVWAQGCRLCFRIRFPKGVPQGRDRSPWAVVRGRIG